MTDEINKLKLKLAETDAKYNDQIGSFKATEFE